MNIFLLHALRLVVLSIPLCFLLGCGGGDGGSASVNAQNTTTEQQILDKLNVLESKIDGLNLQGVTQNWDKNFPSASRFTVLANFGGVAVRDNNTGLVWEKQPVAITRSWVEAIRDCVNKSVGSTVGWRLPSAIELKSLQDAGLPSPFVPTSTFTGVQSFPYWSATTVAENSTLAWLVDFAGGNVGWGGKTDTQHVWCVRGPMNADAY